MRQIQKTTLITAIAAALLSSQAFAVSSFEYNAGLQFNFSNPGARSLGMGGAYLGFSDDATAAYTNPAGLTVLSQPEIALEYRATRYSTPFVAGGSAIDGSVFEDESRSRSSGPSYMAAVYPGEGWAVAAYRNVELDFTNEFIKSAIPFSFPGASSGRFIREAASAIDAKSVNYGLSGAYEVNENFSIGLSAVYTLFDLSAASIRGEDGDVAFAQIENADAEAFTYNLGVLYKFSDKLSIGAAYRRGAEFDTNVASINLNTNNAARRIGSFNIPHQFGLGVAYRATDNFAVGFDAHYVDYSTLSDDPLRTELDSKVEFDSGVELRLGAEYVFSNFETPFILRAGVWRDPDHRFAFQGTATNVTQFVDQILFPEGDAEMHYSLGLGWALERLQLDLGADFSDPVKTYSASGVVRF
jgi:long-chain fatty acid transport protein